MGSQPIRIQLGKILWENLAGKSCGKFLWENLVGNSCGKFLQENLVGKSCRTRRRGKSQFKKGSGLVENLAFWNRVMGSQPIRIQLGKILREKSCGKNLAGNLAGKFLQEKSCRENLVGNSCRKILLEILGEILVGNAVGNSPYLSPKPFSER